MDEMTFPEFLEKKYLEWQLKEEGRKTIVQFAAYIGVSQPILSMWLSGKKRPGVDNIKLLAEIFGDEVYDSLGLPRPNPYLHRSPAIHSPTLHYYGIGTMQNGGV